MSVLVRIFAQYLYRLRDRHGPPGKTRQTNRQIQEFYGRTQLGIGVRFRRRDVRTHDEAQPNSRIATTRPASGTWTSVSGRVPMQAQARETPMYGSPRILGGPDKSASLKCALT
jgi:hypothetical protein